MKKDVATWSELARTMAESEVMWHHREACVDAKQSREDGVSVHCSYKNMDRFAMHGQLP